MVGRLLMLLQQEIDGGSRHLGDTANSCLKAEFAELFIFVRCQSETDHAASGVRGHVGLGDAAEKQLSVGCDPVA